MSDSLSAYLKVMDIEQWVLRTIDAKFSDATCLASFPANTHGHYLIVCGSVSAAEGQGDAFEGEVADLLNDMLRATQWPANQCVLLADLDQLSLAIEQVQPSILLALGEVASQAVLQGSVQSKRQKVHQLVFAKVVVSYHPVQVQQNPKQFKRLIWEDLKLAMLETVK